MFSLDFLAKYHSNLFYYVNQLFETKNHRVCYILSNEYHYVWKNWYNGKDYCFSLSHAIKHKEEESDINKNKNNDFKIKMTISNF